MSQSESIPYLCTDPKYEGFDVQAGKTWIYPTNYPLRDYQFNIIEEALVKNTLVSLPTGLGKTFIAAVVMYNFYRWYPTGKIIFMAPTRPLVKQQIDACYNIMAIPKNCTAELTGSNVQTSRSDVWKEKRVFFVTAQVLSNDLDRIADLGPKIKCLVFDEAHRAKGNYAYCLVIRKLLPKTKNFRVLALSATPGNNINDVGEVVHNLLISHIELRTDESPDISPFTFQKYLETVVVPLGHKLTEIRDRFVEVLEKHTRILLKHRVIHGNCSSLTKGKIFMTLKDFQEKNRSNRCDAYSDIMRSLNVCVTLYHGFELLIRHGLRSFLSFFQEHAEKPLLRGNTELFDIMKDIDEYLGPPLNLDPLPDGTIPEIPENTRFGHPKFYKLCDILSAHFTRHHDTSSRVIVFCEYRESVMEAYALLLQQKPLIRPKTFLGQGAITQRQQLNVIQSFVRGDCNTLISTCIGEEGLDVGEVDLIVCFDISNKSPVRMIQRIGRTGRKRDGRVVIMVTEGKEEQTLRACLLQKHYLAKTINNSHELMAKLYKENSRMIPDDITPVCSKIHITVKKDVAVKNETIKGMLSRMESFLTQNALKKERKDRIPEPTEYWNKKDPLSFEQQEDRTSMSKYLEKQRKLQPTGILCHSKQSELLVSLLQFADSKRYNIPVTQMSSLSQYSQIGKESNKLTKSDGLKQSDLRSMLVKNKNAMKCTNSEANLDNDINRGVANYLQSLTRFINNCKICENFFDCASIKIRSEHPRVKEITIPDLGVLESINSDSLNTYLNSLNPLYDELSDCEDTHEATFSKNDTVVYEPPANLDTVLQKCNSTFFNNLNLTEIEQESKTMDIIEKQEVLKFFKLESLSDIFEPPAHKTPVKSSLSNDETVLYCSGEKLSPVLNKTQYFDESSEGSPILCSYERVKFLKDKAQKQLFLGDKSFRSEQSNDLEATQISVKPRLSNLMQRKRKPSSDVTVKVDNSVYEALNTISGNEKSYFSKQGILSDIDDVFDINLFNKDYESDSKSNDSKPYTKTSKNDDETFSANHIKESQKANLLNEISDFCDLSLFESSTKPENTLDSHLNPTSEISTEHIDLKEISCEKQAVLSQIEDICDLGILSLENNTAPKNKTKESKAVDNLLDLDDICDLSIFNTNKIRAKMKTPTTHSITEKAITQDSMAFFDDSFFDKSFKTPKKSKLDATSKRKNVDAILKKYLPEQDHSPAESKPKTKAETQLSVTQIINIVNGNTMNSKPLQNTGSDSENEFETTMLRPKSASKINQQQVQTPNVDQSSKTILNFNSDDDFEAPLCPKIKSKKLLKLKRPAQQKKSKQSNPFVELEAEVSLEEGVFLSEDETVSDDDCLDASFVNDETQIFNSTQMHAHYLQSVKSPRLNRYKIPKLPKLNSAEVFSQPDVGVDDTYLNDSFCVGSQMLSQHDTEPSELEIAEMILEQERKRKRKNKGDRTRKKRAPIITDDSD